MPATRTGAKPKGTARQLTLTGELASVTPLSSSSKSRSKSSIERSYTDAILPIKPEFTKLIAEREKNHEYRRRRIRDTVTRIWLYTTAPTSAISHVVVTSHPKTPGQVCDPSGLGNDDFDNGEKESKFGYPVLGLYKLKTPLEQKAMKQTYGVSPPQAVVYAPKKMV
ncbi:hypothetical protein C7212DRAFT_337716, partial [Tuber magnatum]